MLATTETKVEKDLANKKITVIKQFSAPPQTVFEAWTTKEILDQWWAPKPWRAETASMEFKEGGSWLYAMVGPEGERHNATVQYTKIDSPNSFEAIDAFADEKGNINKAMPQTNWKVDFKKSGSGTQVTATITSSSREDLEKMLEMGFEEGFKLGLNNLEEYLESNH